MQQPARAPGTTVRSRLLWLVAACTVPASLGAAVAIGQAYREARAAVEQRAQAAAQAVMDTVDLQLVRAGDALQALGSSPVLTSGDLAAFHRQALQALPHLSGGNIVLSTPAGQQVINTLEPYGQRLPLHGNPALQAAAVAARSAVVSDVFSGGVTRRPMVAVEVPVLRDGTVLYTLAMGFEPEVMSALLARLLPEPNWLIVVTDRQGHIVARTLHPQQWVGRSVAPGLLEALHRSHEGVQEMRTLEGAPVLTAFTHSRRTGWSAAVGVPTAVLMAPLWRWLGWLVLGTLLLFALGITLAVSMARQIGAAIRLLVPQAEALGRGLLPEVPPIPLREPQAVAEALLRAGQLLRLRTAERDAATQAREQMRHHSEQLAHEAQHDALTELHNRRGLLAALREAVRKHARDGGSFTLLYLDLDDFKPVNDQLGHAAGDELLRAVGQRLRTGLREADVVARLGGDEFAVLLQGVAMAEVPLIAEALLQRLSQPYVVRGETVRVTACIGIAGYPDAAHSAEALLEAADAAMYRAKAAGKRTWMGSSFGDLPR